MVNMNSFQALEGSSWQITLTQKILPQDLIQDKIDITKIGSIIITVDHDSEL